MNKKEEVISLRLFGGLGNQIFQYMAGKWLAAYRNLPLHIDNNWLHDGYGHPNSSIFEFGLYKPDLEYGMGHKNFLSLYIDRFATIASRNIPFVADITKINAPKNPFYEDLTRIKSGIHLRGYYQSPQYFYELLNMGYVGKKSFQLIKPSKSFEFIYKELSAQDVLAVHVRAGDYLKKKSPHRNLDSKYYQSAIESATEICGNLPILVFSDDILYAKKKLSGFLNLKFVDGSSITAAENMKLMSMAKGIVSANSTFSYWAGMMSEPKTLVVAPKDWMINSAQPVDFFPKDWILI